MSSCKAIEVGCWGKMIKLGGGAFGTVYQAQDQHGYAFAVKVVPHDDAIKEATLLRTLDHENIIKCWGYKKIFQAVYIYLEVMNESIAKFMARNQRPCTWNETKSFSKYIVAGISYLHSKNIIHRDIKCDNILLDVVGHVKIGDLGLAKEQTIENMGNCFGDRIWMSPEARFGMSQDRRADVWSLGCTVYEMKTSYPPFCWDGRMSLRRPPIWTYEYGRLIWMDEWMGYYDPELKDFLCRIFVPVDNRPYIQGIMHHKWLSGVGEGMSMFDIAYAEQTYLRYYRGL